MRYYRTTGLTLTQMQELVRRVNEALDEPWNKRTGRPKSLRLYKAVEAACMYLRQNATQEFIGETRDTSQPTISRYTAVLVPLVKAVLEEFVPDAAGAIEIVRGRVVLVDGTLAPCWSYAEHPELWNGKHKTTGFNAQLISLLDGTAVWISGPLPGKTHDAKSFTDTGAAQIVEKSGGGFGDKGYQGTGLVTPKKKPEGGELTTSDKEYNSQISSLRAQRGTLASDGTLTATSSSDRLSSNSPSPNLWTTRSTKRSGVSSTTGSSAISATSSGNRWVCAQLPGPHTTRRTRSHRSRDTERSP